MEDQSSTTFLFSRQLMEGGYHSVEAAKHRLYLMSACLFEEDERYPCLSTTLPLHILSSVHQECDSGGQLATHVHSKTRKEIQIYRRA